MVLWLHFKGASGDYGFPTGQEAKGEGNVEYMGFSSLLFGAVGLAPSKDTFWTNGTQPGSVYVPMMTS